MSARTTTVHDPARHRERRELSVAVLLAALGGGLALFASSRQWWVEQTPRPAPLPALREPARGTDVVPWGAAMGLVSLAGAAALLATRRLGRLAVGLLLVAAGIALVCAGGLGLSLHAEPGVSRVDVMAAWPVMIIVGGALAIVSGAVTCLRFRRWRERDTGLSSRYEAPSKQRHIDSETDSSPDPSSLWDALDRGVDPTRPPPAGRSGEVK